jgi:hypothetical protein
LIALGSSRRVDQDGRHLYDPAMRSVVAAVLLAPLAAGCSLPQYDNPPKQLRIEKLWKERDICLLTNTPQFDDHVSDPRKIARFVAMSCTNETTKLLEMTIPEPDAKARAAFQQEAERRAATIVVDFRRVDTSLQQHRRVGDPTPLQ